VPDVVRAINAGAQFVVSPSLSEDVALYCKKNKIAYFPGALTPTEIERSWNSGAAMVKLFPASVMGPEYINILKGPFNDILILAVGGIKALNAGQYLKAGASAVAIGGSIFSPSRIENKEFDTIKNDISKFIFSIQSYYSTTNKISI
jgi:2-dehydro-3-deoxyphosphogluconate aldolase/(4S)-4-hydroxy-2-oxoglutarate aldolase